MQYTKPNSDFLIDLGKIYVVTILATLSLWFRKYQTSQIWTFLFESKSFSEKNLDKNYE